MYVGRTDIYRGDNDLDNNYRETIEAGKSIDDLLETRQFRNLVQKQGRNATHSSVVYR